MGNQRGQESFNPGDPKSLLSSAPHLFSHTSCSHTPRPTSCARPPTSGPTLRTLSCDSLPFRFLLNHHVLYKASPPAGVFSPLYLLAVSRTHGALPLFSRLELEEGLLGTSPHSTSMTPFISAVAFIASCTNTYLWASLFIGPTGI